MVAENAGNVEPNDGCTKMQAPVRRRKRKQATSGQLTAEKIARLVGSWRFIIVQSIVLSGWIVVNLIAWQHRWDPYPFVFLNLMLSFQAAYTAPLLLIAQNRQDELDRELSQEDHTLIQKVHEHLCAQDDELEEIKKLIKPKH